MDAGGDPVKAAKKASPRRAVLDLAPLELDCMNTLWPVGEGTVRDIRDRLAAKRPRAYTTIMTIMDRLARKGIVERRKVGRAYMYRPNLSAEDARSQALAQVIDNFFSGSKEDLLAHLNGSHATPSPAPRAFAAAASAAASSAASALAVGGAAASRGDTQSSEDEPAERIDDTLL